MTKPLERPATVSVTRMDRLANCPHSLMLDLTQPRVPSHAAARGTIFHEFAEHAVKQMGETGEAMIPGDVCRDLISATIESRPDLVVPAHEQDVCRQAAWNFGEHHSQSIDLPTLAANESLLATEIGGWTVRGRVDRAHLSGDDCHIYDYKTGLHIPSGEDVANDLKLALYCLLLGEGVVLDPETEKVISHEPIGAGASRFWPSLVFPRIVSDVTGECVTRSPMKGGALEPVKREDFHDLRRSCAAILAKLDRGLDEGEWDAVPGSWCGYCPAQALCPLPLEVRPLDGATDAIEAAQIAKQHAVVDAQQRRRFQAMKAWVKANDSIRFGDQEWTFNSSHSRSIPRKNKAKQQELLDAGKPIPADLYTETSSSRFTKRKVVADA